MKPTSATRHHILYFLREKGAASAAELAEMLKITLSAVRQQLSLLEGEGYVEARRQPGRPGRPLHLYSLTEKSERFFYKDYAGLSLELIEQMIEDHGRPWLQKFLENRKKKLAAKHIEAQKGSKNSKDECETIARVQNEAGYMARMDYEEGLPMLKEHNCPFIEVATKYPEFCEAERQVYEEVLGRPVMLKGCRARGATVCTFCLSGD